MKRIAIVTTTRAEYGLLSPVIKELRKKESNIFIADLIVSGTHLSEEYGMTINEIDDRIDFKINIPLKTSSDIDISMNQADFLIQFTKLFSEKKYNAVVILGDRYEMLAVAIAAGNTKTPIFHLCGGDTTEGALDEWIRHSITKMSYLHFVTNEESRKRVIQLGENPDRVFNYGSTSIDNILRVADMNKKEALESVGIDENEKYAICTYHPVTMMHADVDGLIESFIEAIKEFSAIQFIITKSNSDQGGARINELLDKANEEIENVHVYPSLGIRRYLSLMKSSEFVLGNSSSGIVEAPAFGVPTVNIGNRQRGRLQSESIINCAESKEDIVLAIKKAQSDEHRAICRKVVSPYGDGKAAGKIADKIFEVVVNEEIDLMKKFYDM